MPLLQEFILSPEVHVSLWSITESPEELLHQVTLSGEEQAMFDTFRNELRKKQWLATRALLRAARLPGDPSLTYDANGKPSLSSQRYHISISHAGLMAAFAWRNGRPLGIDIERVAHRIERVKERFLNQSELDNIPDAERLSRLTVMWGAKEALYKVHGNPGVDFRNDLHILPFDYLCGENQQTGAILSIDGIREEYAIYYRSVGEYMLVVAY